MSIGTNTKKRRFELRISQQDLANMLGYKTRSTIAKIETGENDIAHKKLQQIAEVLDTTVEALPSGNASQASSPNPVTASAQLTSVIPSSNTARSRTAAVILAGGKSSRNQQNIPNQFINILGKPVIVYCL